MPTFSLSITFFSPTHEPFFFQHSSGKASEDLEGGLGKHGEAWSHKSGNRAVRIDEVQVHKSGNRARNFPMQFLM